MTNKVLFCRENLDPQYWEDTIREMVIVDGILNAKVSTVAVIESTEVGLGKENNNNSNIVYFIS